MSPEQTQLSGVDVDTSSDVYSLGILLYELLTGTTPLSPEELKQAAQEEVLRRIRETEPPRPSNRISSLGETSSQVSECRSAQPEQLGRLVKGDLDWIVMKALEKDRNRRYKTADAFAADIGRHLTNEPVEARPPSTAYRLSRFYRRNTGTVLGVATSVVVLLAVVAVLSSALRSVIDSRKELKASNEQLEETQKNQRQTLKQLSAVLFDQGMSSALAGDYDTAANYLNLLQGTDSDEQVALLNGFLQLCRGNYDDAIAQLEELARLNEDNLAIRSLLTVSYDAAGRSTDWFRSHRVLNGLTPNSAEDYLFAAIATYTLDPYLAVRMANDALLLRRTPLAYLIRARATSEFAMHSGDVTGIDQAIIDADIANAWFEHDGLAGFNMLATYLFAMYAFQDSESPQMDRLHEAAKGVEEALKLHDKMLIWDDAYLASYYYWLGQKERALDYKSRATKPEYSENPSAHYLALAFELGQSPDPKVLRAVANLESGEYSEYVRGFLANASGEVHVGGAIGKRLAEGDVPLDVAIRGLELLDMAGQSDTAESIASGLRTKYEDVELDVWSEWLRTNVLPYYASRDDQALVQSALDSRYKRRWQALCHSSIGAYWYGQGNIDRAKENAEKCVAQGVYYLFVHECWRAMLARDDVWRQDIQAQEGRTPNLVHAQLDH